MPKPGDVVTAVVKGAHKSKLRPVVVVSSDTYHSQRPDVVLGLITTNIGAATASTDRVLLDWQQAGLHAPSAYRSYFGMAYAKDGNVIGHLSDRDWQAVKDCLQKALG